MPAQSSHQLEQFENIRKPQLSAFGHMLEEQVPGVRGDFVPLERIIFGVECPHLGSELAGHLWRDFELVSGYRHARKIGIRGRNCQSGRRSGLCSLELHEME
ncbi:hypothetical protein [Bradyrhizobium elkanii]|uniref:hypothetical protein n=1 Tax=Bradyrhizobium elkanii TaxID=29448 RepID=UPI001673CD49|nr:hypothetical protein [Bradyrhizobium elkanii]